MLSHIRGRLLRSSFVESALRFSTSASYSSNKRDDPKVIVGTSEPSKDGSNSFSANKSEVDSETLLDNVLEASFGPPRNKRNSRKGQAKGKTSDEILQKYSQEEEVLQASFIQPKRVNFQRKSEGDGTQRNKFSRMKPGQLNIKMVDAAKKVAAQAGLEEKKVMNDIMDKLDEVFVGIDTVRPGKKKSAFNRPQTDVNSVLDAHSVSQDPAVFDSLIEEGNKVLSVQPQRSSEFVGSKSIREFKSIDELLKLEPPLKIFNQAEKPAAESELTTWQTLEAAEIRRATRFEPLNWFDQCIVWTEEGKLWHFPINNEQGMDEEAEVDFTEHLFLDQHIEHWCPKEGPIKHFMELVTVGLSKNPYITVAKKKETLQWYENYFLQNQALLEEIDAFGKTRE